MEEIRVQKTNFISMLKESKNTMEVQALSIEQFQFCIMRLNTTWGGGDVHPMPLAWVMGLAPLRPRACRMKSTNSPRSGMCWKLHWSHSVGCRVKRLDECYPIMTVEDITFSFTEV